MIYLKALVAKETIGCVTIVRLKVNHENLVRFKSPS